MNINIFVTWQLSTQPDCREKPEEKKKKKTQNSEHDQLPVGLTAQLVEHCTGITEVMGSNPVQV